MFAVSCGCGRASAMHGRHSSPELWAAARLNPSRTQSPGPASHRLWKTPHRSAAEAAEVRGLLCAGRGEKCLPPTQLPGWWPCAGFGLRAGIPSGHGQLSLGFFLGAGPWFPPMPAQCSPQAQGGRPRL